MRLRTHWKRTRFAAAETAVAAFLATLAGLIGMSVAPVGAGSNGLTTYEADCAGAGLAAGQTAPFIEGLAVNGAPDPSAPSGALFGVSGTASSTLIGPVVAGVQQVLNLATLQIRVNETVGSTDGTATGSFPYDHLFASQTVPGRQVAGVSWNSGSTTLTAAAGAFLAGDVGKFVAGPAMQGIVPTSTILSIAADGSSATISVATTAPSVGAVNVGTGENMMFADPAFSTGNVFTTNGVEGGKANIGVTSVSSQTLVVFGGGLMIVFGGSPGVGPANCVLTGFDAANNPGPAQQGQAAPLLPADPDSTTPLVLANNGFISQPGTSQMITPPAAAFVNLQTPDTTPPVAGNATASIDRNTTNTASLALPATDNKAVAHCDVVPNSISDPRLSVSISNSPTPCQATLTDNGSASVGATVTFQDTATDTSNNTSASPGTVTVTIVPAVDTMPPTTGDLTTSMNAGATTAAALPATDNVAVAHCDLVPGSVSDPRLSVSIAPNSCQTTLTDSGSTSGTVTFQYNATDTSNNTSVSPGTVTVDITGQVTDDSVNAIAGNPRAGADSKRIVAKVTNLGTGTWHVCDTDVSWTVPVGTVASLNPGCADLRPGASKRFRFRWTYGAGTLTPGQVVNLTASVPVRPGDINAANNSDTEQQTAH